MYFNFHFKKYDDMSKLIEKVCIKYEFSSEINSCLMDTITLLQKHFNDSPLFKFKFSYINPVDYDIGNEYYHFQFIKLHDNTKQSFLRMTMGLPSSLESDEYIY
eukprot:NODE_297_length_11469_cov_0.855937.p8 type:complete len:104 gc:universal NODE_297_length_11469_cov_0.855937:4112-3801(-)